MTLILLTGAGFSRNWGGWLANEAFEYILGREEVGPALRARLWTGKTVKRQGFEDTLAQIQEEAARGLAGTAQMVDEFMAALIAMFNEMNQGLASATFEWQNQVTYLIDNFLSRFDFIFTLNQDLLLERHYLPGRAERQTPGLKLMNPGGVSGEEVYVAMRVPEDPSRFKIDGGQQPYIKLHGSSNWMRSASGTRLLVLGGGKSLEINREPLLKWYHSLFAEALCRPDAKLMVIGYSFSDPHINDAITAAADRGNLSLFIVDPDGADVLDKQRHVPMPGPQQLMDKLNPCIRGASRRPLSATFGFDRVEHAKLTRFLSR